MVSQKLKQKQNSKPRKMSKRASAPRASFGPVTSISTAPVSIGNSVSGSRPVVTTTVDGCRVQGRDFGFELAGTSSSVTGWTLVGGFPVTPSVLPSSALRSYTQMYGKFKINALNVHYITASATSQTGDVMFYYERDRAGPCVDWTNSSFLPYILSDPNTIIGPQWMNHTLVVRPTEGFKSTDYGVNIDLNEEACGTIFMFSKTASASSPGYIIFDYDITFKQLQVNPRAGVLPISRGQWSKACIGNTTTAVVSGTTAVAAALQGNNITNVTAAFPTGAAVGDIYKIVFDTTNSTIVNAAWTNVGLTTLLRAEVPGGNDMAVTIDDGFTCYGVLDTTTSVKLYPTLASILASGNAYTFGVTATISYNLCVYMSYISSLAPTATQFSY